MLPVALSVALVLPCCLALQATENCSSSTIIAPQVGSTISQNRPVIIGIALKDNGSPLKKKPVTISMDNRKLSTVVTNKNGVWSYIPKMNQLCCPGIHAVQARINPSTETCLWSQGTMFMVQSTTGFCIYKSGNVSATNSLINFPFESAALNTGTPTIVGSLLDASFNPVANETVHLEVDSSSVGNPVSDSNGVFSLALSTGLADGSHTITAHCVQSNVDLTSVTFTVDTVAPDAPAITYPAENDTVTSTDFTVTGTSEANATVTTYLDSDPYGEVCYADDNGNWSIDYSADNGSHTISAQATDLAGNQGSLSSTTDFTVSA